MDAFLQFLSATNKYGKRIFVSEAPGPVFLLWADFENGRKLAGLTLVRKENSDSGTQVDYKTVLRLIKQKLGDKLPVLEVVYNDAVTCFTINKARYNPQQAAELLAGTLQLKLGRHPAKRPNDPEQINDGFHRWSREVFDGISVRKADIDAILLTESCDDIASIIEIKRSAKKGIGCWTPYMESGGNTDYWNYVIGITFSKMVGAHFQTFHHELMKAGDVFTEESRVERFEFRAPTLLCRETLEAFAASTNRKIFTGKDFTR